MNISLDVTLFIQLINFFISLLIINYLIIKPIRSNMARRKAIIDADNKDTENFMQSMGIHNLQYEERISSVRAQIAKERDEYKKNAEEFARGVLGAIRQESTQKIQNESSEALQALQADVSSYSKEALAKILA